MKYENLSSLAKHTDGALTKLGSPGRFAASLLRSVARRRVHVFSLDRDGDWVNRQLDGTIVSPVPHRSDLRRVRRNSRDLWLFEYVPGPGDVVMDVGAGVGEDCLSFDDLVRPNGRVYAVDAHPRTFACLEKTVARSGLSTVRCIHAAVTDHDGTEVISDDADLLANTLRLRSSLRSRTVPACRLDTLFERLCLDHVDFLKMNIEGAERTALVGLSPVIDRVRHIVVECHDFVDQAANDPWFRTLDFVSSFLTERGFELRVRSDDARPFIGCIVYGRNTREGRT